VAVRGPWNPRCYDPPMMETDARERAIQASRRLIARGERPLFRIAVRVNGDVYQMIEARSVEFPWIVETNGDRDWVVAACRTSIAIALGARDDDFRIELVDA
jgi:hypothetical protein